MQTIPASQLFRATLTEKQKGVKYFDQNAFKEYSYYFLSYDEACNYGRVNFSSPQFTWSVDPDPIIAVQEDNGSWSLMNMLPVNFHDCRGTERWLDSVTTKAFEIPETGLLYEFSQLALGQMKELNHCIAGLSVFHVSNTRLLNFTHAVNGAEFQIYLSDNKFCLVEPNDISVEVKHAVSAADEIKKIDEDIAALNRRKTELMQNQVTRPQHR